MFNLGEIAEKSKLTDEYRNIVQKNVKLADFTSFKIGGNADIYITPSSYKELAAVLRYLKSESIPAILLGGGTNILIPDEGIRGAVIHTCKMNTICIRTVGEETAVEAEAGTLMKDLTDFCAEHGLSGLEDFAGLPGTVGGAVFMNARCYEKSISDVFLSASVLNFSAEQYILNIHGYQKDEWAYKSSPFQPANKRHTSIDEGRSVIVSALFKTIRGNKEAIRTKMEERIADRTAKGHFKLPSAGSTFKNNHAFGNPSGKLIDEAGLRGMQIGGAQVAPWHGNFIVNTGTATAEDVIQLIRMIQLRVKDQTGFELEPEIILPVMET